MIVADFATVYGDDWFVVPVEIPRGTLSRVTSVEVVDNFDAEPVSVAPVATTDERPLLRARGGCSSSPATHRQGAG